MVQIASELCNAPCSNVAQLERIRSVGQLSEIVEQRRENSLTGNVAYVSLVCVSEATCFVIVGPVASIAEGLSGNLRSECCVVNAFDIEKVEQVPAVLTVQAKSICQPVSEVVQSAI